MRELVTVYIPLYFFLIYICFDEKDQWPITISNWEQLTHVETRCVCRHDHVLINRKNNFHNNLITVLSLFSLQYRCQHNKHKVDTLTIQFLNRVRYYCDRAKHILRSIFKSFIVNNIYVSCLTSYLKLHSWIL